MENQCQDKVNGALVDEGNQEEKLSVPCHTLTFISTPEAAYCKQQQYQASELFGMAAGAYLDHAQGKPEVLEGGCPWKQPSSKEMVS